MGWTGIYSSAASLKEAAEIYSRNVSGLGYSKQFNSDLSENIYFEIEDYRLKGKKLTLLLRNTRDPLHREIVCHLIDLDKEQSEFYYKDLSVFDGLVLGFPMVKTWSRQLTAQTVMPEDADARRYFQRFKELLIHDAHRAREYQNGCR